MLKSVLNAIYGLGGPTHGQHETKAATISLSGRLPAGATAVCIVCYVIPVALHLKLYLSKSGYQLLEAAESPSLAEPLLQVPHHSSCF